MRALILSLLLAGPALAQSDDPCVEIFDHTQFCGRPMGWKIVDPQPFPGLITFLNQEFSFSVSHQSAHGQNVTGILYDSAIRGLLHEVDRRHDAPPGTHQALFVETMWKDNVEGRRFAVISEYGDTQVSFVMDIYYSRDNGWVTQTTHAGPIKMKRLLRVHDLVVKELRFDP